MNMYPNPNVGPQRAPAEYFEDEKVNYSEIKGTGASTSASTTVGLGIRTPIKTWVAATLSLLSLSRAEGEMPKNPAKRRAAAARMAVVTLVTALVATLAMAGGVQTASAATTAPPPTGSSFCSHPGLGGVFFCNSPGAYQTGEKWVRFPNGVWQVFVIGTDRAVYTAWSDTRGLNYTPWIWMGGVSLSYVGLGPSTPNPYDISIAVTGTDHVTYYRHRGTGNWTPWAPSALLDKPGSQYPFWYTAPTLCNHLFRIDSDTRAWDPKSQMEISRSLVFGYWAGHCVYKITDSIGVDINTRQLVVAQTTMHWAVLGAAIGGVSLCTDYLPTEVPIEYLPPMLSWCAAGAAAGYVFS
jgi:hypothetical protein